MSPEDDTVRTSAALQAARLQLEQVCRMLLRPTPEVLVDCESVLEQAAAGLEASRRGWARAAGDPAAGREALLARKALMHAYRLLETAGRFHARWQRMRAAMDNGYRADGKPPELRCRARISVEG